MSDNSSNGAVAKDKKDGGDPFQTEEDKQMMESVSMLVDRLQEPDHSLYRPALEALRTLMRTSTATMTSIPKALKFLRPHFDTLAAVHSRIAPAQEGRFLADILSVIAMTLGSASDSRLTLKYRLQGQQEPLGDWGHEYVRHVAMEAAAAYLQDSQQQSLDLLRPLVMEAVAFFLDHNAEPDACDLLFETESLDSIVDMLQGRDHQRICLYLQSCVPFEASPDDQVVLKVVYDIYRRTSDYPQALIVALRLGNVSLVRETFEACPDPLVKRQLAIMLARERISIDCEPHLRDILNNTFLTDRFRELLCELDIAAPKTPEDVYKSHLLQDNLRVLTTSAKSSLASVFVNGFVNAASCADIDGEIYVSKNKDHGVVSAVAAFGLIHLWNADSGLAQLDRYLYSDSVYVKAGAILGIGLLHTGTRSEADPAWALLREYLQDSDALIRTCALIGLALAYAGSARSDLAETIIPHVSDSNVQVGAIAALALGHVFVGSCSGDVASVLLQNLMERQSEQLQSPIARMFSLALALLFLGRQESDAEPVIETLNAIDHSIARETAVLIQICSYVGTGNVLKVQEFLHHCSRAEESQDESVSVVYAVLGVALVSMAEDIGKEMALRIFSHLMHHGQPGVRKAVPLALGLLYASNPAVAVTDTLGKCSHDHDKAVAVNAICSLGLVAAGTNNAKVAQMLRQLAVYYQRDPDCLYAVRIAQALVHMGKGTMSLNPLHAHRSLVSLSGLAGLLSVAVAFSDAQSMMLENSSYLFYFIVPAIYPRFLWTLDEDLKPKPILVRVGQAVDVVGQAGKPKTITGFQTHATPVLLAATERAEFATEEYLPLTPILEGFVIVKRNPEWRDDLKK